MRTSVAQRLHPTYLPILSTQNSISSYCFIVMKKNPNAYYVSTIRNYMPQSQGADVGREGYDKEVWEEAVRRVEDDLDRGTSVIHDEVVEIFSERDVDGEEGTPSYRTTFNKLYELRKEGKVANRRIGNTVQWFPQTEELEDRVLRALRERESGTAEKISENLGGIDVEEVESALRDLRNEDEVESEDIAGKEVWVPLD